MIRAKPLLALVQIVMGALLCVAGAHADGEESREAQALRLFKEARSDMGNGRYAEACPKFAESNTLYPGAGTMLNLAYCHEKLGKRAQAWGEYQAAAVAAHDDGKSEWEDAAHARAGRLEASIAWIVVHVDKTADVSHLTIQFDGQPFEVRQLERPTPVDPGRHDVKVSAVGKQTWATTVDVDVRDTPTVDVPALEPLPIATVPAPSHPPPASSADAAPSRGWSAQRITAVVLAGAGVGALGLASGLGLSARSTYLGADCQGQICTPQGSNTQSRAIEVAGVATVAAVVGVASLASAAILWWTSPPYARTVRVGASAGPMAWGLSMEGAW
jgi:hypothetical protein